MRYVTPLRYPGGKAKLAPFMQLLLRKNALYDVEYVEPYAGGASVALSLLLNEYVSRIHINDLDRAVYAFWSSVLSETDALCAMIRDRRVSRAEWHRQRAVQENPDDWSDLELGYSTFFLNRTNRSGIICSGGMIGGNDQDGEWKIDARYNKDELIQRIQRVARLKDRISLYNLDAAKLLRRLLPKLPRGTLLYLDPPYYVKGSRRLYANFYGHKDHERIAGLITNSRHPWVVSYDDAPSIRRLYRGFRNLRYNLDYTARDRYAGAEIMFFAEGIRLPTRNNPTTVARDWASR